MQPLWNLRELGLSDLRNQQLDELVSRVLPHLSTQEAPLAVGRQAAWRTSHVSTNSFFYNKHGEGYCEICPLLPFVEPKKAIQEAGSPSLTLGFYSSSVL